MLQFSVLGPVEVSSDEGAIRLGGKQQRALLALLLLEANRVVSADFLIDRLWGERPPRTAPSSLQNTVSQLRRLFGAGAVEFRPPGYVLHVDPEQLDLTRFERLVEHARGERLAERAQTLREALALWRGEPLAELTFEPGLEEAIRALTERQLLVLEERIGADLELGRHAEVVPELETLVARRYVVENENPRFAGIFVVAPGKNRTCARGVENR